MSQQALHHETQPLSTKRLAISSLVAISRRLVAIISGHFDDIVDYGIF